MAVCMTLTMKIGIAGRITFGSSFRSKTRRACHRCEYIFYRGVYRVGYARVSRSTITDTVRNTPYPGFCLRTSFYFIHCRLQELQVGKFVLPKFGHPVIDAPREERYLRIYREDLPSSMYVTGQLFPAHPYPVLHRRFPDEYLNSVNPGGKRGHFYHVHPWPLYHRLPDNATV